MDRAQIVAPAAGIQVNHCKTVGCPQFGATPLRPDPTGAIPRYRLISHPTAPVLYCEACSRSTVLKSNLGVADEVARLGTAYSPNGFYCPTRGCENAFVAIPNPDQYQRFGSTPSGSQRYRCRRCRTTIAIPRVAIHRQRRPELNAPIFKFIVNKTPQRRICEVLGISPSVLYNKTGFVHRQCVLFNEAVESRFDGGRNLKRVYLASDRQDYTFNWGSQFDRKNVRLRAVGTADNYSNYVFGVHLDFDPTLNAAEVEVQAKAAGDLDKSYIERRFARLWLLSDYDSDATLKERLRRRNKRGNRDGKTATTIRAELARRSAAPMKSDLEEPVEREPEARAPPIGMQVRAEYAMTSHFYRIEKLVGQAGKLRFYLDSDPGLLSGVLAAFRDRFKDGDADAFYVQILKSMTDDQKRSAISAATALLQQHLGNDQNLAPSEARLAAMTSLLRQTAPDGVFKNVWVPHPFPNMHEPVKKVMYCTSRGGEYPDNLGKLFLRASLHSIDKFFMQVRRRISTLERPVRSSNALRSFYAYQGYNPAIGAARLEIFRIFHNFVLVGKDRQTPAMRIGIATRPFTHEEILSFVPGGVLPD